VLKRGNFLSLEALRQRLLDFIDYFNRTISTAPFQPHHFNRTISTAPWPSRIAGPLPDNRSRQGWSEFHNGKGWLGSKRSPRSEAPRTFALWGLEDSTPATLLSFPTATTDQPCRSRDDQLTWTP